MSRGFESHEFGAVGAPVGVHACHREGRKVLGLGTVPRTHTDMISTTTDRNAC